jgi:transcription elongation factor B subunit 1
MCARAADYKAACVSKTIKGMLSSSGATVLVPAWPANAARSDMDGPAGTFTETEHGEVRFPEISTPILERVCQYFYYKLRYQNSTAKNIPEFPVAPELALELLMAGLLCCVASLT